MVDGGAFAAVDLTADSGLDERRAQAEDRICQPAVAEVGETFEAGIIGSESGRCAEVDGQSDGAQREADPAAAADQDRGGEDERLGNMFSRSG